MMVRELMRSSPRSIRPAASLADAGRVMEEARCGALPVVGDGEEERVVGMLTDRDLCLAVALRDRRPSEIAVREVISGDVHTCRPDEDVRDALATMGDHRVRRLPVVDAVGRLVGLLSFDDLAASAGPRPNGSGDFLLPAEIAETLMILAQHEQRLNAS
jgi:CBS domain-containing protein